MTQWIRIPVAAAMALLAALSIIGTMSVKFGRGDAAPRWLSGDHPELLESAIMAEVGSAAAAGRSPPSATMDRIGRLAVARPLSPIPFLVRAALAQRSADDLQAERLLLRARELDPRSRAARYLLADHYLRHNRVAPALTEMAVLNRLVPGATSPFSTSMAAYARLPGAVSRLRNVLRSYPELQEPLLVELSSDPDNANLVLALGQAGGRGRTARWQPVLLSSLINRGDYDRAYAVWMRLAGLTGKRAMPFNPSFQNLEAPPPFNWKLNDDGGAIVESGSDGLEVLYPGRGDISLAQQVLLLEAGRYRIHATLEGSLPDSGALRWRLSCLPAQHRILDAPLKQSSGPAAAASFEVPGKACAAQRLELFAREGDTAERADFRLREVRITRVLRS